MNYFEAIQQAVTTCLQKYADFKGRAGRPEFWWFVLAYFVVNVVVSSVSPKLGGLVSLGLLLPALAAGARRFHDIGKSGWWQLLSLIPFIGWMIVIYWEAQPGDAQANAHGEPPAAPAAAA